MINEQQHSDTFTDRQEVLELFKRLRERDSKGLRPLLPILTLIAPAGSGKSALIDSFASYHDQNSTLPYAFLDFSETDAPKDLLNILGALRDQLQMRRGLRQQKRLTFPRFEIVFSRLKRGDTKWSGAEEVDQILSDLVGLFANLNFFLGLLLLILLSILRLLARIPLLQVLLRSILRLLLRTRLGRPEWRWYQEQTRRYRQFKLRPGIDIKGEPDIEDMGERLSKMSTSRHEKDFLIKHTLPDAFLADLRAALDSIESTEVGVVLFLDSFEELQRASEPTSKALLEVLALSEQRKPGESDPLLLVIGSEDRLPDMSREQLNHHYVSWDFPCSELLPWLPLVSWSPQKEQARVQMLLDRYSEWQKRLPAKGDRRRLKLEDLYLPLPLRDFGLDETRTYLLLLEEQQQTQIFHNEALIQAIYRQTCGYLSFLASVAHSIGYQNPQDVDLYGLFTTEDGEKIVDDLLAPLCTTEEVQEYMLCTAPRILTVDLVPIVLGTSRDSASSEIPGRYRRLSFGLASHDRTRVTFHPGVRALLLQKLAAGGAENTYRAVHQRLRDYFQERFIAATATGQRPLQDRIERAYHQLALGDYEPVVQLATYAQKHEIALWNPLLEAVAQAPTRYLPTRIEADAERSLRQASIPHHPDEAVRAIILYTWLLARPEGTKEKTANNLLYLAQAFRHLRSDNQQIKPDVVNHCFEHWQAINDPIAVRITTQPLRRPPSMPLPLRTRSSRELMPLPLRKAYRVTTQSLKSNRITQIALSLALVIAIVGTFALSHLSIAARVAPTPISGPFGVPLASLQPSAKTQWIGVRSESNQEYDGISDGSVPFDFVRPDGALKIKATSLFHKGDFAGAITTLQTALKGDINDAEALIYQENARILQAQQHCTIFVVATNILEDSGEGVNIGRDNLQGAYTAQKENNDNNSDKICLYIANLGTSASYAPAIAQQIVSAMAANPAIKGVMGWPLTTSTPDTTAAMQILENAHIPLVSTTSYDALQNTPNVFHVAPSEQAQGQRAALYAAQTLHKRKAALFVDPFDSYSRSLAQGFEERFMQDGNAIVSSQIYTANHTDFTVPLQEALKANPDLIYFAGNRDDGRLLLNLLANSAPKLPVLAGDAFYAFVGYSTNARPGDFSNLSFTTLAYPYAPSAMHMQELYAHYFDPGDASQIHSYGYSLPDSDAILSYDAMQVLLTLVYKSNGSKDALQVLANATIIGASRAQIAFDNLNALRDTNVFLLTTGGG